MDRNRKIMIAAAVILAVGLVITVPKLMAKETYRNINQMNVRITLQENGQLLRIYEPTDFTYQGDDGQIVKKVMQSDDAVFAVSYPAHGVRTYETGFWILDGDQINSFIGVQYQKKEISDQADIDCVVNMVKQGDQWTAVYNVETTIDGKVYRKTEQIPMKKGTRSLILISK